MRVLLIQLAFRAIAVMLGKSIRNEKLLLLLTAFCTFVLDIVEKLTDDDQDNTAQIEKVVKEQLPKILELLTHSKLVNTADS